MSIHIVLQGKGGVGKSLVAALLAQYLASSGTKLFCADTDPVNNTFSRYQSIGAKSIHVLNSDQEIDARIFDALIEELIEHDGDAVIDNGASTFIPLAAYLSENGVIDLLRSYGKTVYIHTVLTGGQAMDDTLSGLVALLRSQPAEILVWENEFFGLVERDEKRFIDLDLYQSNKKRIKGIINIKRRSQSTFGRDIELMVSNKLTFNDAMTSSLFSLMPRQRLMTIKKEIFDQLITAGI